MYHLDIVNQVRLKLMARAVLNALQDHTHLNGTQHNARAVWKMQYDWEVLKCMLMMSIGD